MATASPGETSRTTTSSDLGDPADLPAATGSRAAGPTKSADHEPLLCGDPGRERVPLRRRDLLRDPQGGQGTREEKVSKEPEYFESRCDRLYYPNLPCVQTGSAIQPLYLSLEVCGIVEGQHCKRELDENQTSEMIKRTGQASAKRFNEIRQSVQDLVNRSDQSPNLSRFAQRDSLENLKTLVHVGADMGTRIKQPMDVSAADTNQKPIGTLVLEEQHKQPSLAMTIIILAKNVNCEEIKQVAENKIGLHTQCVMDNVQSVFLHKM
ncbi:hypothetical protein HPB50_013745 [Hyalomma asiaticum]|uniref:Uncharacterized protein n=1 Tax=Hyalomma asiaticum TaxID=266040 RepID=A0ACB7TKD8_HYAAI|nr:hypothetical protein HPB50_013745 [Hyalomma asiaticum]